MLCALCDEQPMAPRTQMNGPLSGIHSENLKQSGHPIHALLRCSLFSTLHNCCSRLLVESVGKCTCPHRTEQRSRMRKTGDILTIPVEFTVKQHSISNTSNFGCLHFAYASERWSARQSNCLGTQASTVEQVPNDIIGVPSSRKLCFQINWDSKLADRRD